MIQKEWIPILLSLTVFICHQPGNSLTEILRNEHLVVAGNDSDGISKVWITPKLSASTIVVPLDGHSISSAYSEQSSKSRELTVESSYISNTMSQHHIFVPLENGILNVTFMYNGSAAKDNPAITLVQPHKLYHLGNLCLHMCASLGVYRIGATLYTLCASSRGVCICELRTSAGQPSFNNLTNALNCHLLQHPRSDIDVHKISNTVVYPNRAFSRLLFALNNSVYQTVPLYGSGSDSIISIPDHLNCLVITRLQIVGSKLSIYCVNNSMVEYDMDHEWFLPQFNNHLYFPCSETVNFSVNLTNTEISYRMNDVPRRSTGLRIGRFKFGECITHESHPLFLYINSWSSSLHIVNSSMFTLLNFTYNPPMCMNIEYDRPVTMGKRYIIAYDLGCQITSVFDLHNIASPVIIQTDKPLQLAAVIFNLSTTVTVIIEPTITTTVPPSTVGTTSITELIPQSTSSMSTLVTTIATTSITTTSKNEIHSTLLSMTTVVTDNTAMTPLSEEDLVIAPPILIGTFIIVIVLLLFVIIGTIVILTSNRKKLQRKKETAHVTIDLQTVSEHGTNISSVRNLAGSQERISSGYSSTHQLLDLSSRDTSRSSIVSSYPSTDTRQAGPHNLSSVPNNSYGLELSVSTVPVEESSPDESVSNTTQQVVGSNV